jgi:hypothetical protein
MNKFVVVVLALLSSAAFAEDGLVVQYTVVERDTESRVTQSYTNAVLMRFDEEVSTPLNDYCVIRIRSKMDGHSKVNLLVTLKDVFEGKPYYVGAQPVNIEIGGSAKFELRKYGKEYEVSLDTSYGKLPE